ncbi:MAG: ribonuclease H-like domain-containing protein [Armatimonadota bacterium]|nr:ribonuclease H-like domain-containing protein [Armatimonadota bacterium]
MSQTSGMLRDRLALLGVVSAPRTRLRTEVDRGPAYEIRRNVRSVREVFGRDAPHPADAGALFLDTETTGLAGGTGTTPFLIGLASIDDTVVTVEQYFLRRLSGEAAMLEALHDRLVEAETLVTFNGRRFDWPILEARFIMSRLPLDPPADHADLITFARRLWYRALGTYRLTAIERHALGIERTDDVDSAEIPGMYLEYLRTGDAGPLEPVFAHNQRDVLCLLHLRRQARRWIEEGEDPPPPVDWEGLGVLRQRAGDSPGAMAAWCRALTVEDDHAVRWRIATRIARVLRREARWDDLLALWEHQAAGRGVWRVRALIERAKILHRRLRQPERAIAALDEARTVLEWLLLAGDPAAPALDLAVQERLARLGAPPPGTVRLGQPPAGDDRYLRTTVKTYRSVQT